ncbi:carbohydrate sulfotransferase 9-like [Saccoglossus kowalevskii]
MVVAIFGCILQGVPRYVDNLKIKWNEVLENKLSTQPNTSDTFTSSITTSLAFSKTTSSNLQDEFPAITEHAVFIWEDLQRRRKEHVATICQQHPELMAEQVNYGRFLVDDNYKILYCPVAKVASSNWRRVMLVLRGTFRNVYEIGKGVPYKYKYTSLNSYTNSEIQLRMRTYTKFMFSRHPFTKLLSAYNDKLSGDSPKDVFLKKIVPRVNAANKMNYTGAGFTFQEFVNYILETDPDLFDGHWGLIKNHCNPCNVKFDFLGKFETLSEDVDGILRKINASEVADFSSYVPHRTNSSSIDTVTDHFSHLTEQQIEGLYAKYKIDFDLFDYDNDQFLNISQSL